MSETDEIRKENEITLKLSGKVKFSTTYDDKDPVYTMNIEVTFYSPQMNLPFGDEEEK